jgi:hypothetical protein
VHRYGWDEGQQQFGPPSIAVELARALHGLGTVRNDTVAPATEAVAHPAEALKPTAADGTLGDNAVSGRLARDGSDFDHEAPSGRQHLERGVIEVTAVAALVNRRRGLEDPPVQTHRMASGAEWDPVEANGCFARPTPSSRSYDGLRWDLSRTYDEHGALGALENAARDAAEERRGD